jgi:hypothetical protein
MMEHIKSKNLKVEQPDYGDYPDLQKYLQQNLKAGTELLISMFVELNTLVEGSLRHKQLIEELDSAILGWVETWVSLNV